MLVYQYYLVAISRFLMFEYLFKINVPRKILSSISNDLGLPDTTCAFRSKIEAISKPFSIIKSVEGIDGPKSSTTKIESSIFVMNLYVPL